MHATVLANQGWGPNSVRVGYVTTAGTREQGTLNIPGQPDTYPVGSTIMVAYDPSGTLAAAIPFEKPSRYRKVRLDDLLEYRSRQPNRC